MRDDLVEEGNALEINNMIDMEMLDTAQRVNDKNVIDGWWVLRLKRPVTMRA